jgi:hypothetical protein
MKNTIIKRLIWVIPFTSLAILTLYFEINSYTNTKGSFGELFLYPYHEKSFLISAAATVIIGLTLIFIKSKMITYILVGLICFIVFLFYPFFEMRGIENPF